MSKKYTFVIDETVAVVLRRQLHLSRVLATMQQDLPDFLLVMLKKHLTVSEACLRGLVHMIVGSSFGKTLKAELEQFETQHPESEGGESGPVPAWVKAHVTEVRDLLLSAQKAELMALPGPEREKALAEMIPEVRQHLGM